MCTTVPALQVRGLKIAIHLGTLKNEWSCVVEYINCQANLDQWLTVAPGNAPSLEIPMMGLEWDGPPCMSVLLCRLQIGAQRYSLLHCRKWTLSHHSAWSTWWVKVLACPGPWEAGWQSGLTSQKLEEMKLHGCLCLGNTPPGPILILVTELGFAFLWHR